MPSPSLRGRVRRAAAAARRLLAGVGIAGAMSAAAAPTPRRSRLTAIYWGFALGQQLLDPRISPPNPGGPSFYSCPQRIRGGGSSPPQAGLAEAEIDTETALTMELPLLVGLCQGCTKLGWSLRERHGVNTGQRGEGSAPRQRLLCLARAGTACITHTSLQPQPFA